ncbi:MAG: hypothetical protein ACK40G_02285 [Cytophagaceae bacterium]
MRVVYLIAFTTLFAFHSFSQSLISSKDFKLGTPNTEPDDRSDIVKLPDNTFVIVAKTKGGQTGKSDFMMEKYDMDLNVLWGTPLSADASEDFKDLIYNGKEIILLSVIHKETEKKTKLMAYTFDPSTGKAGSAKELESFDVGDWDNHAHKGKVKESFVDVICEHANKNFVTPFEYKHNISYSPDGKLILSYVFNYGEKNLNATVSIYDKDLNLKNRGKVGIDNDYTNHGMYVDNKGLLYIVNVSNSGKTNLISYDLSSKDFQIIEVPASNFKKDDLQLVFKGDNTVFLANTELSFQDKVMGVKYVKCNFSDMKVESVIFESFSDELKKKVNDGRKSHKQIKGEEDWTDYDLTHFIVNDDESVFILLEKRDLYAEGYPHIRKGSFDKSHNVEVPGHVHTEGIIVLAFDKEGDTKWQTYIPKSQVYPASDGLNSISFVLNYSNNQLKLLYATSENFDGQLNNLNYLVLDAETGNTVKSTSLPNSDKLQLVREYTIWSGDHLIVVGKKGMMGKSSTIAKYKLN